MDERERIRLPADKATEEWAQFGKRLLVRSLVVAAACVGVAALGYTILGLVVPPGGLDLNIGIWLFILFWLLLVAAGVSCLLALLGLSRWGWSVLDVWIRNRNQR
jgi:hypothetical protein